MSNYFPAPATQSEFKSMCVVMSKTDMVPAQYRGKPEAIFVAAMWGAQLGLSPIVSVQNIAVINGKPAIYGDLAKAVCYKSGLMTSCLETIEGTGDKMVATCTVTRKDDPNKHSFSFSVDDAKRAQLWGKKGPWSQYPKRMLQMRARGFALRDVFPDVLAGMITAEEAQDYPEEAGPSPAKTSAKPAVEPTDKKAQPAPAPRPEDDLPVQDAVMADAPTEPEAAGPDPDIEDPAATEDIGKKIVKITNIHELVAFYKSMTPEDQQRWKPTFTKMKRFIAGVETEEKKNA